MFRTASAVLRGERSTSKRIAAPHVSRPVMATIASSEQAIAAKLPATSCQRGRGLPSRTSIVPRSSAPAIAPAAASIGKNASASGASKKTCEFK